MAIGTRGLSNVYHGSHGILQVLKVSMEMTAKFVSKPSFHFSLSKANRYSYTKAILKHMRSFEIISINISPANTSAFNGKFQNKPYLNRPRILNMQLLFSALTVFTFPHAFVIFVAQRNADK